MFRSMSRVVVLLAGVGLLGFASQVNAASIRLLGGESATALELSSDGHVVVGYVGNRAAYWKNGVLATVDEGDFESSRAVAVSRDGGVIAINGRQEGYPSAAYTWTSAGGFLRHDATGYPDAHETSGYIYPVGLSPDGIQVFANEQYYDYPGFSQRSRTGSTIRDTSDGSRIRSNHDRYGFNGIYGISDGGQVLTVYRVQINGNDYSSMLGGTTIINRLDGDYWSIDDSGLADSGTALFHSAHHRYGGGYLYYWTVASGLRTVGSAGRSDIAYLEGVDISGDGLTVIGVGHEYDRTSVGSYVYRADEDKIYAFSEILADAGIDLGSLQITSLVGVSYDGSVITGNLYDPASGTYSPFVVSGLFIPEPLSVALLALGGIGLLRRRH